MRKLIVSMSQTFDGFMAGPKNELDWLFLSESDDSMEWTLRFMKGAGAHLMGRKTFYDMASHWPTSTEGYAPVMNEIPKIVFSRKGFSPREIGETSQGLEDAQRATSAPKADRAKQESWNEAIVLTGELADEIKKLKSQPGGHLVAHGGVTFIQNLIETGLVDEYYVRVHPQVIGQGKGMFEKVKKTMSLKLQDTTPFSKGMVGLHYLAK